MRPVRWRILSTAKIGLVKLLPAIQRSGACDIVAIASPSIDPARGAAVSLGIPPGLRFVREIAGRPGH